MKISQSTKKRFTRLLNSDKFKKENVSRPESVRQLQSSADGSESALTQQPPAEPTDNRKENSETQADQRVRKSAKSESTWDLAPESLKQKRPDFYLDLQDLRNKEGSLSSSEWLQKVLAECRESRDDAHARSRTNIEKILQSVLVYKRCRCCGISSGSAWHCANGIDRCLRCCTGMFELVRRSIPCQNNQKGKARTLSRY
jgi:hypothetical protein